MQNGSVKLFSNFLRTGEYLTDMNGNWFIYITPYGAIIDNNGNVYNENSSGIKPPRILKMNRYGSVYLRDNLGTILYTIKEIPVPESSKATSTQTLFITGDGKLELAKFFLIYLKKGNPSMKITLLLFRPV
jgi:hypothetical protein